MPEKKLTIMWLCHLADSEIQRIFPTNPVSEFAPWISALRDCLMSTADIDLRIVAPNVYSNQDCEFTINKVKYYFYKHYAILPRRLYNFLCVDFITRFWLVKRKVLKAAKTINPDLIHIHGSENVYYSSASLSLAVKYRVLLTIQGFRTKSVSTSLRSRLGKGLEISLLKKIKHFGVRTSSMEDFIKEFNPGASFYWHVYPFPVPNSDLLVNLDNFNKCYDIIFFASIVRQKGIEDLLKAVALLKNSHRNISLIICGLARYEYRLYLNELASQQQISDCIQFAGFLERTVLHETVIKARVSVLPTYADNLPGTILESMYLGVPVVTYDVDGISILNKDRESVLLVKMGDIAALARAIETLLSDKHEYKRYSCSAKQTVVDYFDSSMVSSQICQIYNSIITTCRY